MAAPDDQQTEAVQSQADEKWVLLQEDGDAVKEQLLEEQDGDTRGEKENCQNADEGQEGAQDAGGFFYWCRSAWNDVSVHNALWDGMRPYVLGAALSVNTVLHVLTALASLAECGTLQALLISLKHFTTAMLSAAVSSMATRFLSLMAIKASAAKNPRASLQSHLAAVNIDILLATCIVCIYEVRAGIMLFQETRGDNLAWSVQLLAEIAMVPGLVGAVVLVASLVVLMGIDVRATFCAVLLQLKVRLESQNLAAGRTTEQARECQAASIIPLCAGGHPDPHPSGDSLADMHHVGENTSAESAPWRRRSCSKRWHLASGIKLQCSFPKLAGDWNISNGSRRSAEI
ncbi:hypothetical protein MTO96_017024 [Rhipicephalus appendiculatus]